MIVQAWSISPRARRIPASRSWPKARLSTVEADKLRGQWIDAAAGRITFKEYAVAWVEMQTFDPST